MFLGYVKKIKQLEGVKYFKYFSGMMTSDGRCTREIISRIVIAESTSKKKTLSHQHIGHKLGEETSKNAALEHNFDGSET